MKRTAAVLTASLLLTLCSIRWLPRPGSCGAVVAHGRLWCPMAAVAVTALPCPRRTRCRHPGRCLHTRSRIRSLGQTPGLVRIRILGRDHNRDRIHTRCRLLHHRHPLRHPTETTGTTRGPPPP